MRSTGLTPLVLRPFPCSRVKVLVGVVSPTISNVLFSSCGVVVCAHTHNITNSFPFIAAFICGGSGVDGGWRIGGKEGCGVGFDTHPHTLLFGIGFLFLLLCGVLLYVAHPHSHTYLKMEMMFELGEGRSPSQNFYCFIINKLLGWGNPTLQLLLILLSDGVWVLMRGGGKRSSSSMGVLLTLLLFASVVSGSGVDGLSDVEGGEALPQSPATSGLLHGSRAGSNSLASELMLFLVIVGSMLLMMSLKWIKIVYSCVLVGLMWGVVIQGQVPISQAHLGQVAFEDLVMGSGPSATEGLPVGEGVYGILSHPLYEATYHRTLSSSCYMYMCSLAGVPRLGCFSRAVSFVSIGYGAPYTSPSSTFTHIYMNPITDLMAWAGWGRTAKRNPLKVGRVTASSTKVPLQAGCAVNASLMRGGTTVHRVTGMGTNPHGKSEVRIGYRIMTGLGCVVGASSEVKKSNKNRKFFEICEEGEGNSGYSDGNDVYVGRSHYIGNGWYGGNGNEKCGWLVRWYVKVEWSVRCCKGE